MKCSFINKAACAILLLCQFSVCLGTEAPDPADPNRYLNAVRQFADNVLKYGRDTYGPKHTPLFVDGLNIHTHEPVKWISPKGEDPLTATETEEWILSNFASQQTLLRTLDGLSTLTGDPKYRDAAMQAIKYAFANLRSPNGLFYWGFVAAYDIGSDKVRVVDNMHSVKQHHPYYELMWEVDSEATQKLIEAFWSAHVLDWSILDFDRIALFSDVLEEPWNYEYKKDPVLFNSKRSWACGAFFTGTSLAYSGATLYELSGQQQPLLWSKRIVERFVDARNPKSGVSPLFYNNKFDDNLQQTLYSINGMFVFPLIATDGYKKIEPMLYGEDWTPHPWLSVLLTGDMLDEQGKELIQWSLEELTAWGNVSYRQKNNSFVPILADGTNIEGLIFKEANDLGVKGDKVTPVFAGPAYFWLYAAAYRLTGDKFMWQMASDIAVGNNLGNIDQLSEQEFQAPLEINCSDPYSLLGFLELYNKTKKNNFLIMAQRIADNIVKDRFHQGFFVLSDKHYYSSFDCLEALALLHLVGAIDGYRLTLPQAWPTISPFAGNYRYKFWASDRWHIYKLVNSSEVPLSLQEAAHIGDNDRIKTLLNDGGEVDSWDDHSGATALQRAAISGHNDIVKLLIANGAQIDYMGWQFPSTALHYAVQYGHKDVVELLLAHGAGVNNKDMRGRTPIDIASSNGDDDIKNLLLSKAAETSIHTATMLGDYNQVKVLLAQGIDVNAKDAEGNTALHLASLRGYEEIVRLLISKGADVNARRDATGGAPLHNAVFAGHKEIVQLLIASGADVNAKNGRGLTPLDSAVQRGHAEIVEILTKAAEEQKADEEQQKKRNEKPSSESPDTPVNTKFYFPKPSPPFGGNVVTSTRAVSKTVPPKPGYLETFIDPYFGSKITRVSGDKGETIPVIGGTWPQNCRSHYQKDPPWNADGTVLYLSKGCRMFLNGSTYEPLDLRTPSGDARFHPQQPDIMIVLPRNSGTIEQFNIRNGTSTAIAAFSGYSGLSFKSEGNISGNGRWIAPYAVKDGKQVTFAYDMEEKKKYPDIDLTGWDIDWVSICFSGKYVVVNGRSTQNDITQVSDSLTGREVGTRWSSYGHPSHYDLGLDQNDDDVAVGVAKSDPNRGTCIMRRLKDGRERALCPAGSHTGTRNTHRPGWAYIQSTHKGAYVDEVIAVELTWEGEPIVERLAYIPNVTVDYLSETHGAVSFDGRKFCAVSNWGIAGGQIQAYVVDITGLCDTSGSINGDSQTQPAADATPK